MLADGASPSSQLALVVSCLYLLRLESQASCQPSPTLTFVLGKRTLVLTVGGTSDLTIESFPGPYIYKRYFRDPKRFCAPAKILFLFDFCFLFI